MKRLVIAALALSLATAAHAAYNEPPKMLYPATALGAGGSGTEYALSSLSNGLGIPNTAHAVLAILATWADSASADSGAFEVFAFATIGASASDSAGFGPIDLDDSSPRLDGWFCTTLDSTRLVLPGNLTPITGAASTVPKFPYDVSRRIVFGAPVLTASGVAIPGASNVVFGPRGVTRSRWFYLAISDAYGGVLRGFDRFSLGILNRQPRIGFTATGWLLSAKD